MRKLTYITSLAFVFLAGSSFVHAENAAVTPNAEHKQYLKDLKNTEAYQNHQSYVKDFKNTEEYQSANGYLKDLKNSEAGQEAQRYIESQKADMKPQDKDNEETDFSVADLAAGTPPDACKVAICMMGEVTGNSGGSDCRNPIKKFFSINAFKKHHRFNPSKTADWRRSFLGECPDLTKDMQDKIISKFGRVRG